jgi:hypothetical protein
MVTTASAKDKGRRLQQWTRDLILSLWTELKEGDVRSTSMGVSGVDIQLSPRALEAVPLQIECKARKAIVVYDWYEQAGKQGKLEPVLIVKADRKRPLAIVDAEHYFKLRRNNGVDD